MTLEQHLNNVFVCCCCVEPVQTEQHGGAPQESEFAEALLIIIIKMSMAYILLIAIIVCTLVKIVACFDSQTPIYDQSQIFTTQYKPFIIIEPNSVTRVVTKNITKSSSNLKCRPISSQVTVAGMAQFMIFEQNNRKSVHTEWKTQIVSAAKTPQTDLIWVLLSNGTILKLNQTINNIKKFQVLDSYHPTQGYSWFQGEIMSLTPNQLFIQYQGIPHHLILMDKTWSIGAQIIRETVINFKTFNQKLYLLAPTKLIIIDQYNFLKTMGPPSGLYFIDFDITQDNLFLLTNKKIIVADVNSGSIIKYIELNEGQWARRLRATNKHMVIEYFRGRQTILQEFYFETFNINPQNINSQRLLINQNHQVRPGKIHRQFNRIQDIILTQKYAIVVEKFQYSVFQVNVNAETSLTLYDNRFILKADSIIHIQMINNISLEMVIVQAGKVSIVQLRGAILGNDLFRGGLQCHTMEAGISTIQVEYSGICGDEHHWECSKRIEYFVQADEYDSFMTTSDTVIVSTLALMFSGLFCLYKRIGLHFQRKIDDQNSSSVKDTETNYALQH